uniref:Uncharacterized protein n=1 Tax=Lactarius trivialis TaxID=217427 RepID=A0A891ZS21_9AGAM|nr:hypothetical protein K8L25_mgp10 [Lactarius trivialis]QRN74282.1 hypothetical protein [Lactarius trivialis]
MFYNLTNSKILERFNKIINKNEDNIINEPIVIEEDTPLYKNKYVIIGGLLIISGLTWYFYDDLKPVATSLLTWINTFRSRPDPDRDNLGNSNTAPSNSLLQSLKNKVYKRVYGDKPTPDPDTLFDAGILTPFSTQDNTSTTTSTPTSNKSIELFTEDKGKLPDFIDEMTPTEITRRLNSQLTGLSEIKGEDFNYESNCVIGEIETFLNYNNKSSFPKAVIQAGLYKLLVSRLDKLRETNFDAYKKWIEKDWKIFKTIEDFLHLEEIEAAQSDTYEEVANATIKEQDVWSDKANTPASQPALLSPLNNNENLNLMIDDKDFQDFAFKKIKDDSFPSTSKIKLEDLNVQNQTIEEIENLNSSNSSMDLYFKKEENLSVEEIRAKRLEHFSPKREDNLPIIEVNQEDVIKTVKPSPNIGKLGLQTSIEDRLKTSPLIHKTSISNLFDDTMNLFDEDDPNDLGIDTSGDSSNKQETKVEVKIDKNNHNFNIQLGELKQQVKHIHTRTNDGYLATFSTSDIVNDTLPWDKSNRKFYNKGSNLSQVWVEDVNGNNICIHDLTENIEPPVEPVTRVKHKASFAPLLSAIKSKRLEYGSPTSIGPDVILQAEHNLSDADVKPNPNWHDIPFNDSWIVDPKKINFEIKTGDIFERFININFGDQKDKVNKILIITNDGFTNFLDPIVGKSSFSSIKWDNRGITNPNSKDLEIFKVWIMDKNLDTHEIYCNPTPKFLDCFDENSGKSF